MSLTQTSDPSTTRSDGLKRLLDPCDVETFLREYIGEQMLHVSGTSGRWADLFSWRELNTVLNEGFVTYPRVRLVKQGADVDPNLYTYERGQRQWPDSRRCHQLMVEGATLILQIVDGVNPKLETFVRALERDLCADVHADVVATCASLPGLNMHWDNAECFNVQLDGQKHWQVIRPERPYPLTATHRFPERQDVVKLPAPESSPTWDGMLVPGDLIYLPRGWWHAVTPHVTPSLHLSFPVDIPTASDFLQWSARESVREELARRPLPVWATSEERRAMLSDLVTTLTQSISVDALERYIADVSTSFPSRPDFTLPQTGAPGGPHIGPQTCVRLQSAKPLHWVVDGDMVTFEWRRVPYRFHVQALPALQKLESMRAFTIDELSVGSNRLLIRALVLTLVSAGLLAPSERASSEF